MATITKKNRIVLYLSITIMLCSCINQSKNIELYNVIMEDFYSPNSPPLIISIKNLDGDSISCCMSSQSLYQMMNIKIISEDTFKKELFNYISQNKPVPVENNLFEELNNSIRIEKDSAISNLYSSKGIDAVLKETLDSFGAICYTSNLSDINIKQVHYIIYLSFINNIFFYWDDETGGLFVMESYRGKIIQ